MLSNQILRLLLCAAIVAAAIFAIDRWCYGPVACDITEKRILINTQRLYDTRDSMTGIQARENLAELRRCLAAVPGKVSCYLLAAGNCRLLAAPGEAIALYETALRYDRRPEIYADIAEVQLDQKRSDDAVRNYVTAGMFSPAYIANIADYDVRMRVDDIVSKQRVLPWHVRMPPANDKESSKKP